ncbi:hypothetical protein XELAEV_18009870mg [Xenopus laevis]|uniref:Uncharacterized protein n=1 Tax=Xenopus laevis TaxID=8355 RepID=A0A974I181_XENLA|nr:hypothetical protein XELAEV_18009870mg [Xenopus laevis]
MKGMQCSPSSLMALMCMLPYYILFPFPPPQFQQRCPFFYPKYGSIDRSTFKLLGRPCIPFHSIPQDFRSRVCRLLMVKWNGEECSVHLAA